MRADGSFVTLWAGLSPAPKPSLPYSALHCVSGSASSHSLPCHLPVGLTNGRPHWERGQEGAEAGSTPISARFL